MSRGGGDTLLIRAYERILGKPRDPGLRWRGDAPGSRPRSLRVVRYGDCTWRNMPRAHGLHGEPGFPLAASEHLRPAGVAIEFCNVVASFFEHLPATSDELHEHLWMTEEPDVVIVQIGACHAAQAILPSPRLLIRLRADLGRIFDRWARVIYPPMAWALRRRGKTAVPYPDFADLEAFVENTRRTWPGAELVVMTLPPVETDGPFSAAVIARLTEDTLRLCERMDVPVIDAGPLLADASGCYGGNGYNLNSRGHDILGEALAGWLLPIANAGSEQDAPPALQRAV